MLAAPPARCREALKRREKRQVSESGTTVLVVDKLEEIFTHTPSAETSA